MARGDVAAKTGAKLGNAIVARTNTVQMTAASNGRSQPAKRASRQVIGEDVRRRLSTIFQRPLAGIAADRVRALPSRTSHPRIHGNNCQSPRAQR